MPGLPTHLVQGLNGGTVGPRGAFSYRGTIDSPQERRTFILRPRQPGYGDPAENRTCKRTLGAHAS